MWVRDYVRSKLLRTIARSRFKVWMKFVERILVHPKVESTKEFFLKFVVIILAIVKKFNVYRYVEDFRINLEHFGSQIFVTI